MWATWLGSELHFHLYFGFTSNIVYLIYWIELGKPDCITDVHVDMDWLFSAHCCITCGHNYLEVIARVHVSIWSMIALTKVIVWKPIDAIFYFFFGCCQSLLKTLLVMGMLNRSKLNCEWIKLIQSQPETWPGEPSVTLRTSIEEKCKTSASYNFTTHMILKSEFTCWCLVSSNYISWHWIII